LLHEAGPRPHHPPFFRIVDGADDDWAFLVHVVAHQPVGAAGACLDGKPVPSELTYLLVSLDKQYTARGTR